MIPAKTTGLSALVENELNELERLLGEELSKGNSYVSKEALRLLKSGGKRLRPLFTLLFAMSGDSYHSSQALHAAASIETMHMATLIHDDTIDNATHRRGIDTTFAKHGIHTAVYTGDWMFVKSLQLLSGTTEEATVKADLLHMLAKAMEAVCDGEISQYYGRGAIPSISTYFSRIKGKTAAMFVAACVAGAKIAGLSDEQVTASQHFGENFGIAFQIIDDLIDVESTLEVAGKPVKNDLNEGIITLPVLMACRESKTFRSMVRAFLQHPTGPALAQIREAAVLHKGIALSKKECSRYISRCISCLKQLPEVEAMDEVAAVLRKVFSPIDFNVISVIRPEQGKKS